MKSRNSLMLVDIVGPAGSGKSTVAPQLNRELSRAALPKSGKILLGSAEDEPISSLRQIAHLAVHPLLIYCAYKMTTFRKEGLSRKAAFVAILANLARRSLLASRARAVGQSFMVVPQGVVFLLQGNRSSAIQAIPEHIRPSVVIQLKLPISQSTRRKIMREKPHRLAIRNNRSREAGEVYKILRLGFNAEESLCIVRRWNERFCIPKLTDSEVRLACVDEPQEILEISDPAHSDSCTKVSGALVSHRWEYDVLWVDARNDDGVDTGVLAESLAALLLESDVALRI